MQLKRARDNAKLEMDSAKKNLSAILVHLTGSIDQIKTNEVDWQSVETQADEAIELLKESYQVCLGKMNAWSSLDKEFAEVFKNVYDKLYKEINSSASYIKFKSESHRTLENKLAEKSLSVSENLSEKCATLSLNVLEVSRFSQVEWERFTKEAHSTLDYGSAELQKFKAQVQSLVTRCNESMSVLMEDEVAQCIKVKEAWDKATKQLTDLTVYSRYFGFQAQTRAVLDVLYFAIINGADEATAHRFDQFVKFLEIELTKLQKLTSGEPGHYRRLLETASDSYGRAQDALLLYPHSRKFGTYVDFPPLQRDWPSQGRLRAIKEVRYLARNEITKSETNADSATKPAFITNKQSDLEVYPVTEKTRNQPYRSRRRFAEYGAICITKNIVNLWTIHETNRWNFQ